MAGAYHFDLAADYSLAQLSDLVTEAFRGYALPVYESASRLSRLIRMQGLDLSHSVVIRSADAKLVGITFLGLRNTHAWVSAFGIVPSYRGRGLARLLLERVVNQARTAGALDVRLEVLTNNLIARRVYTQFGFQERRELVTLERSPWSSTLVRSADLRVERVDVAVAVHHATMLERVPPCWQREAPSLVTGSAHGLLVRSGSRVVGSALHSAREGTIALHHIVAAPDRSPAIVGAVVTHLVGGVTTASRHITLLNEPDPGGLAPTLGTHGFRETMRQLELHLDL